MGSYRPFQNIFRRGSNASGMSKQWPLRDGGFKTYKTICHEEEEILLLKSKGGMKNHCVSGCHASVQER